MKTSPYDGGVVLTGGRPYSVGIGDRVFENAIYTGGTSTLNGKVHLIFEHDNLQLIINPSFVSFYKETEFEDEKIKELHNGEINL